jgi:antitoxin component YwqK of YwqJK toxin-antitoxin module
MKAILLILCALLAACNREPVTADYGKLDWKDDLFIHEGQPFTGLAIDKHPNGRPKCEYPMKAGRIDGVVREWYDNGQPSVETHFDNGKRDGLNRYWSREGKLTKEQVYDQDHSVSVKHFE